MEEFRSYLKLYWPFLMLAGIGLLGIIYAVGFETGKQAILASAAQSRREVRGTA